MTALPAYCPRCRILFPFTGFKLETGASVSFSHVHTICPVCYQADAQIGEGVYRATQDAVEIISGPASSRSQLEALKILTEKLKAGQISKEQALIEAAQISPRYEQLISLIERLGIPGIMLLLTIISVYLQLSASNPSDETHKIVEAIAQQTIAITQQTDTLRDIVNQPKIKKQRKSPSGKKAEREPPKVKQKNNNRQKMKRERRNAAVERRRDFGGSRAR